MSWCGSLIFRACIKSWLQVENFIEHLKRIESNLTYSSIIASFFSQVWIFFKQQLTFNTAVIMKNNIHQHGFISYSPYLKHGSTRNVVNISFWGVFNIILKFSTRKHLNMEKSMIFLFTLIRKKKKKLFKKNYWMR